MITVKCEQPGFEPIILSLKQGGCTIGSGRKNDIIIPQKNVSKKHAVIGLIDGKVMISDLGSMSGTWVNEERIVTHGPLGAQDSIVIGTGKISVMLVVENQERSRQPAENRKPENKTERVEPSLKSAKPKIKSSAQDKSLRKPKSDEKMIYWRQFRSEEHTSELQSH